MKFYEVYDFREVGEIIDATVFERIVSKNKIHVLVGVADYLNNIIISNLHVLTFERLFDSSLREWHSFDNSVPGIFILMTLGLLGIASGCLILVFQPYDILFKLKVVFSEGGEIFELWRSPPVDLYLKVYLFNVTNKDEFLAGKEDKLRFNQVGPYVYKWVYIYIPNTSKFLKL